MIKRLVCLFRRRAYGGSIQGPPPWDSDRVGVLILPGYVSYDNGQTWHEVP